MLNVQNKRRLIISIVVPIICFVCFFISFIVGTAKIAGYKQINIFSDISECYALDNLKADNRLLNDRYIKDIAYEKSYTYKLNYDSHIFKIYAYEFENINDAKKYYSEVWGHTSDKEHDFNISATQFRTRRIVRNGVNVYRIDAGGAFAYTDIMRHLNSIFTVTIYE